MLISPNTMPAPNPLSGPHPPKPSWSTRPLSCTIRLSQNTSAYLLVLISKDGNHRSLPPGRYACELIKEDSGQWRFSRRTVFHDHDYTLDGIGR